MGEKVRAWTPEAVAQVLELRARSWSQASIARKTGFTPGQINARFRAIRNNRTPGGKPHPGKPGVCPPRIRVAIQQKSADLGFSAQEILSDDTSWLVSWARGDVMRHIRETVVMADGRPPSYPQIGAWFGRNHTSVLHAINQSRERAHAL